MITLTEVMNSIEAVEAAIRVMDTGKAADVDRTLWDRLWSQRAALNMTATFLIPNRADEAIFQHGLIEELTEYVEGEPTRESDKEDAIAAILRLNNTLRDYNLDTSRSDGHVKKAAN
jgi:hypothetical protein